MEPSYPAVVETGVEETSETITHVFHASRERTDWPTSILVSEAIERVADKPTHEIEPLAHSVDPDALDGLFTDRWSGQRRTSGEVTFPIDDYRVTVTANEQILVTEGL